MFLLSFVKGSKSAEWGKNPLADMDSGGPNLLGHRQKKISGHPYISFIDMNFFSESRWGSDLT